MPIQKKITIIEVYCIIGTWNNNAYHLRIIIKLWTYVVEYIYLNDLNFYLNITDLYVCFNMDFIFSKTEKCSCHWFYSINYLFPLYTLHHHIRC